MMSTFACALALYAALLPASESGAITPSQSVVFAHVTVIDMTGGPAKPDMTVVVKGGHIVAVDRSGKVHVPHGSTVIDCSGKFLIPGLWDMHVHFDISGKAASMPMYIANGVTGVRDMGGDYNSIQRWRSQSRDGRLLVPTIVAAGPILDGKTPGFPLRMTVENAADARRAVVSLKKRGVDFIKVHNLLSRSAYFSAAAESKRQRLDFAGHVPFAVTAAEASNAGQKSIEHLSGLPDTYDGKKGSALFGLFVKNRTWQCPTLVALRSIAFLNDSDFINDERMKYVPSAVKESWAFQIDKFFRNRTPETLATGKASVQQYIREVGALRRAGVEILAGTDVGVPYVFPGFSLHDELALLVQAGLTPMEALQSATRNPAKYLGLLQTQGTVERGKIADLVLLDEDPLWKISNSRKIAAVMLRGRLLPKAELQRMLSNVPPARK